MTRKYFSPKRSTAKHVRLMAESRGETKYLGTPCKHGHSGMRYVSNGDCIECRVYVSRRAPNQPERDS